MNQPNAAFILIVLPFHLCTFHKRFGRFQSHRFAVYNLHLQHFPPQRVTPSKISSQQAGHFGIILQNKLRQVAQYRD